MRETISGGALTETMLLILLATCREPVHGYGMMQFIEQVTDGRVSVGPGTLYGCISHLLKKGWIKNTFVEKGTSKKIYSISETGIEAINAEKKRMLEMIGLTDRIQRGANSD